MSVAEINNSPLQLASAAVVMAIENNAPKLSQGELVSSRPAKGVVVAVSSPVLEKKSSSAELVSAVLNNLNADPKLAGIADSLSEIFSQITDDFSSLDEKKTVAAVKGLLTELMSALGGDVAGIRMMMDQLDEVSAANDTATEQTSDTEQFSGTTSADAKKALAEMAASALNAQGDTAEVQQTLMEESTVMSNKTLGMIEGQRIEQDNNYDQQMQNAQKQKKVHFWTRVVTIVATSLAVAAVGLIFGPGAAVMLAAVVAMQMSGADNKMFDQIDNPALKAFVETAFVVGIAVASGGGAALIDAGFATATSVGEVVGEEAAEQVSKSVSDEFMEQLSSGWKDSVKNTAIMVGGQLFMTSDLVEMTAAGLTDLFFIGRENADNKKMVKMAVELVLTIVVAATMMYASTSLNPSELGMDSLATGGKVLMAGSTGFQIATGGLNIYDGALQLGLAALQKEQGVIEADLNEDFYLNQSNMDWMKSTQSEIRNQLKGLQESLNATLKQLCDPIKAAARVISRA